MLFRSVSQSRYDAHMMDALRYGVQAVKELDFFGSDFYDSTNGMQKKSVDYEEDWSTVWV